MAKYKIAWLPGDGVGIEVLEAAKIVLDESISTPSTFMATSAGSSGARRATPFRSGRSSSSSVDAAMFGAITSKPMKAAEAELDAAPARTGLIYRSPIVRMRQLFDLYICLRPCKALSRQSAQLQGRHRPDVSSARTPKTSTRASSSPGSR
jgi:isocitrate/isopropylmalate dehydrogenase